MSSITAYETSKGKKCYQVRYRKPDGSTTRKAGFATKKAAEIWAAKTEIDKNSNEYIDASKGKKQAEVYIERWLASRANLKPSSIKTYNGAATSHVLPVWGKIPIQKITHNSIQEWVLRLSSEKSPTVCKRAYQILAGSLDIAIKEKILAANPAREIRLPRNVKLEHRYLTHQEVHAIAQASEENALTVYTLAYTGMRWGELAALRVKDFDLITSRLSITRNAVYVGGEWVVGSPKNGKGRTVRVADFLAQMLNERCGNKAADDLIFCDSKGNFLRTPKRRYSSWIDRACAATGIEVIKIHDLRHTAASLAISAGANVKAVQRMLGHSSAAMTLDIYAGLFDDDLDEVAVKLNNGFLGNLNEKK